MTKTELLETIGNGENSGVEFKSDWTFGAWRNTSAPSAGRQLQTRPTAKVGPAGCHISKRFPCNRQPPPFVTMLITLPVDSVNWPEHTRPYPVGSGRRGAQWRDTTFRSSTARRLKCRAQQSQAGLVWNHARPGKQSGLISRSRKPDGALPRARRGPALVSSLAELEARPDPRVLSRPSGTRTLPKWSGVCSILSIIYGGSLRPEWGSMRPACSALR